MAVLVGRKKGKQIEIRSDGSKLIYRVPMEFLVYDSSGTESEASILRTAGLPLVNSIYPIDGITAQMVCKSKTAQQWDNNNKYWNVSCEIDNEPLNDEKDTGNNENDAPDPTTWYAIVKFDFESYDEALYADVSNKPFFNFAKRPYSNANTVSKKIPIIKFTQYMSPDLTIYGLVNDYHNIVNNQQFLGGSRGNWLLTLADAEFGITNGYRCWKCDFELRWRKGFTLDNMYTYDVNTKTFTTIERAPGWSLVVPQYDSIDINKKPFGDERENITTGKLKNDGTFLTDQNAEPYYAVYEIYEAASFNWIRIRQE